MPKKLIRVTEEHIRDGRQAYPCTCPVALAIRARGLRLGSGVSSSTIGLEIGDERVEINTPPPAVAFIRSFDAGRRPDPFNFYLEVPSE